MGRLFEIKDVSGNIERLLYDGDALVAEYNASGAMLNRYVHGPGAGDDPLIWHTGPTTYRWTANYLYADRQGSIVEAANFYGNPTAINSYDEYGVPGPSTGIENLGRFRYTGQTWIPELGQYYYKARMYSPGLGRFMQTDPIGYADGMNMYRYVGNDPVNFVDPTGRNEACLHVDPTACDGVGSDGVIESPKVVNLIVVTAERCSGVVGPIIQAGGPCSPIGLGPLKAYFYDPLAEYFRQLNNQIADLACRGCKSIPAVGVSLTGSISAGIVGGSTDTGYSFDPQTGDISSFNTTSTGIISYGFSMKLGPKFAINAPSGDFSSRGMTVSGQYGGGASYNIDSGEGQSFIAAGTGVALRETETNSEVIANIGSCNIGGS